MVRRWRSGAGGLREGRRVEGKVEGKVVVVEGEPSRRGVWEEGWMGKVCWRRWWWWMGVGGSGGMLLLRVDTSDTMDSRLDWPRLVLLVLVE